MNILSFTVASDTVSVRIDRYLTEQCPELSRSYIQKLLKDQKVKADHKTVKANYKVQPGQEIVVEIPDAEPLTFSRRISLLTFSMKILIFLW